MSTGVNSLKVCTGEYMLSDVNGVGVRRNYLPHVANEQFLESTKDGVVKRAPDPVTFIDGDLTWFNDTPDPVSMKVQVHRAPRSIVTTSPGTVILTDAWSFKVGVSPEAEYPSVVQDTFGGRMQIDRPSAAAADLLFGRYFMDDDDSQVYQEIGVVPAGQALHFRYICALQTPGIWTTPSEYEPRWEAYARWCRLLALTEPVGGI